ncbi:MAG: hypothetical protein AAB434_01555 [Planctomycetota bacterium]
MVDPSRPVGPQPIGPIRPEGTGGATGPKPPPDLFQKFLDRAIEGPGKTSEAQAPAAAQRDSALSGAQALLGQLQRMQQDLSARLASFMAAPTPEGAIAMSNSADTAYDVQRDVRDKLVTLLQSRGLIA